MRDAFTLVTDVGDELILTERVPGLIALDVRAASLRMLEKEVANPQLANRRAYLDPVRKLLRSEAQDLDALAKGVLKFVVCNAIWTQTRLQEAGYEVCLLCPLCKTEPDTVHHRV